MIRAVVEESTLAMAGVLFPVNKLTVLIPYITLTGFVVALSTIFIIRRRKD